MKVRDLMTADPLVAEVPGTRDDVLRTLLAHDVSGLPVVRARTRELAGVVTRSDLFRDAGESQLALLMTSDPVTIGPDADVADAARILSDRRIRTLPVVDGAEVVGVVSPSDILRTFTDGKLCVEDVLRGGVCAVHAATPLPVAWALLRANRANALPVLDDDAALVGIVADSDLFRLAEIDDRFRVDGLGNASEDDTWMWDRVRSLLPHWTQVSRVELPAEPVERAMTRDVVTVHRRTSIAEAARRMARRKVNQLPVVDADERLAGLVTDLDLAAAKAQEAQQVHMRA